jgi:hypothetical protein
MLDCFGTGLMVGTGSDCIEALNNLGSDFGSKAGNCNFVAAESLGNYSGKERVLGSCFGSLVAELPGNYSGKR